MRDRDWIGVAAVVWLIGLGALLCEHFQLPAPLILNVRMLFALVTSCAISAVLIEKARSLAGAPMHELYPWTRLISRWVYILMYALALARVCLHMEEIYQHCTACVGPHGSAVRPLDDFQFYIACCVIPLWLARALVLAVPFRNRAAQSSSPSQSQAALSDSEAVELPVESGSRG